MRISKSLLITVALCFSAFSLPLAQGQEPPSGTATENATDTSDTGYSKGSPNLAPSQEAIDQLSTAQTTSSGPAESKTKASHENGIVEILLSMMLGGSEWVLYLLIVLSVVSGAIILERAYYFNRFKVDFDTFLAGFSDLLKKDDVEGAIKFCAGKESIETQIAIEGLLPENHSSVAAEKSMSAYLARSRSKMDRGLMFLGTLGNNAPFIGLFGTVLGIIQAFDALALSPAGGASVVMAGIAEALVATAVGLFVAIPAVIAFNWFQSTINQRLNNADAVQDLILKHYTKV